MNKVEIMCIGKLIQLKNVRNVVGVYKRVIRPAIVMACETKIWQIYWRYGKGRYWDVFFGEEGK